MKSSMIESLIAICKEAGNEILKIYEREDFEIEVKQDKSPLTVADKNSHQIIVNRLNQLTPEIPILSEEGKHLTYEERKEWKMFWLIDPLDGTKEFIKRSGDFTVNISLIEENYPVLGVIYIPVKDICYTAQNGQGAVKLNQDGSKEALQVRAPKEKMILVESRSHPSPELEAYIVKLSKQYRRVVRIQRGSSLKFCAVAEGQAHMYPRLGPTMEWDTAAGQVIVEEAGGTVRDLEGQRLSYNKQSLKNDSFIVSN